MDQKLRPLTYHQQKFVNEFFECKNGAEAIRRINPQCKNPTNSAAILFKTPQVREAIKLKFSEQAKRTNITPDKILCLMFGIADSDPGEVFDDDGTFKNIKSLPPNVRKMISSVEVDEIWVGRGEAKRLIGYTKKIKFWDKTRALQMLAEHLKLLGPAENGRQENNLTIININQSEKMFNPLERQRVVNP